MSLLSRCLAGSFCHFCWNRCKFEETKCWETEFCTVCLCLVYPRKATLQWIAIIGSLFRYIPIIFIVVGSHFSVWSMFCFPSFSVVFSFPGWLRLLYNVRPCKITYQSSSCFNASSLSHHKQLILFWLEKLRDGSCRRMSWKITRYMSSLSGKKNTLVLPNLSASLSVQLPVCPSSILKRTMYMFTKLL